MSEDRYYEFLAIDRPLDAAAMKKLRALSSRAQITPVSFTNHCEWEDFHGNVDRMMERWFDLHLYFSNWGSRRLMMKFPRRLIDTTPLDGLDVATDSVGEYVHGKAHTNGIESFWSMLKRGYYGTYHQMSEKHLDRYAGEFSGRHNVREHDTAEQMAHLAASLTGKQLLYRNLIQD